MSIHTVPTIPLIIMNACYELKILMMLFKHSDAKNLPPRVRTTAFSELEKFSIALYGLCFSDCQGGFMSSPQLAIYVNVYALTIQEVNCFQCIMFAV